MLGALDLHVVTKNRAENVQLGTTEALTRGSGRADRAMILNEEPPL